MDIRKLQRAIVDGLEDVKGQNIVVFNTEHLSALFERVIIASGTSNRQTKALASGVRESVKEAGYPPPRMEGEVNGEWIIVDCGAAVVHVMQPSIREYYHLEEIWGDKPVKMKLGNAGTKLVKAAEPPAPIGRAAAKKTAAKKTAAKKAAAKRPAAKTVGAARRAAQPAAKSPARKAPAQKTAGRKTVAAGRTGVTRVVGVKRAAAKQPAARKTPARKSAAKA
jgi:ribosome-associated protein